jgi:hypothetical protein
MTKIITVQACSSMFCLDIQYIENIFKDAESSQSFLSELEKSDASSRPKLLLLSRLIGKKEDKDGKQKKLVMLRVKDSTMGLLVDNIGTPAVLAQDSILSLPPAFAKECFDVFPQIAIIDGAALPVLTPESILQLSERNAFKDNQA